MSYLDKRKKKKYIEKDLGWVRIFGIILAILTAGCIIGIIIQMTRVGG